MKHLGIIVLIFFQLGAAAQTDSILPSKPVSEKSFLKQSIVPLSLIGSGLIIHFTVKEQIQDNIQGGLNGFHTSADNYLLFAPALIMYGADILKVPAKNDAFTQTKYLLISGISNSLITYGLKKITHVERPDGTEDSFPSGHTSNAFVMATVLHHEFADSNPYIAYSGYLFATATGVLRVLNNRHWVSDVLVGAGLGILVTDLVYRLEPFKNWNPFKNDKKQALIITPAYYENSIGLYANIRF